MSDENEAAGAAGAQDAAAKQDAPGAADGGGIAAAEGRRGGAMPLFYQRPEVLEARQHAGLGLAPHTGYAFAAKANAIPVNVTEFARAGVWYPIVFAGREGRLAPVAVTGLRKEQNLFVDEAGGWTGGAYIPSYVRRYPFILTRPDPEKEQVLLCVDRAAERVVEDAEAPFFSGDEATEHTKNALEFCLTFQRQAMATEQITAALQEADVIVEQQGAIEMPSGEKLRLTDFFIVDEKRLNALPDEKAMELRRMGALGAAYCQMMSMNCWKRLSDIAMTR